MICCVAVVGQENNPIYLRAFPEASSEQLLKLHFTVHCSLDAVEERVLAIRTPGEISDTYLGLLYPTQEFKVYGLLTNTQVKLIVVLNHANAKEEVVGRVLKRLHAVYVDAVSNPFHTFGIALSSPKFDAQVEAIAAAYSKTGTQQGTTAYA